MDITQYASKSNSEPVCYFLLQVWKCNGVQVQFCLLDWSYKKCYVIFCAHHTVQNKSVILIYIYSKLSSLNAAPLQKKSLKCVKTINFLKHLKEASYLLCIHLTWGYKIQWPFRICPTLKRNGGIWWMCLLARLLGFLSRQESWCGDSEMSPCKNTSKTAWH